MATLDQTLWFSCDVLVALMINVGLKGVVLTMASRPIYITRVRYELRTPVGETIH